MRGIKALYFNSRFFWLLAACSAVFIASNWIAWLYPVAWVASALLLAITVADIVLLYGNKCKVTATRKTPQKLSNGDDNPIIIHVESTYPFVVKSKVIDELPTQFQKRDFQHVLQLPTNQIKEFTYTLRPVARGEYTFGHLIVFAASSLGIVQRKFVFQKDVMVPTYPSILQMQQYDFLAIHNQLSGYGLKKIRKIGHTQEFEQIKDYVPGDDIRTINWKATAKRTQLMVNQYQDEKSQPIYSIIDTGRVMKMPFNGLSLLDYAVNTALAFSNVSLKKNDKTGLITFSKTIEQFASAQQKPSYLGVLLELLYNVNTNFVDSDFGLLYAHIKRTITQRSLLMLHTNFEHISALRRQLPFLQAIAKKHVLVVVFFENTELDSLIQDTAMDTQTMYHKTIAEKFSLEKRLMQKELQRYGVQTILTKPEELTINAINKYLEIKARGLL